MEAEKEKVLVAHKHSNNICEQIHSYNNNDIKALYNNIIYYDKHWNTEWLTQ